MQQFLTHRWRLILAISSFLFSIPAYGQSLLYYYAIENINTGAVVARGATTSNGIPQNGVILNSNTRYREYLLRAADGMIGLAEFTTPSPGNPFLIPPVKLALPTTPDSDGDGLSDAGEFIVGTDAGNSDSDNDGVKDGPELQQGTNPLDGLAARTGIIGSVATTGAAQDVCAFNDIAIVAQGTNGISVFNVFNQMSPLIIARVDTPGIARRVAYGGGLIAVADGISGLAVVDISNPAQARVSRQVYLGANAKGVVVAVNLAYVALESGQLATVDMVTGTVLDRATVSGGGNDVALGGDYLYALTGSKLAVFSNASGIPAFIREVNSPFFSTENERLFVGGGLAYATHGRGFNTFSLTDPAQPVLVSSNSTAQFGWKQIVPNGSGLGLAAVGTAYALDDPATHNVSIYDLRNSQSNSLFVTEIPTPGFARAVSIFNGLGYVADDFAGLQVVNYLAYDSQGAAPAITLSSSAVAVEEGKPLRLTATVTDDVQVRNVEFYVNGDRLVTDGNFPFEHRFNAPLRRPGFNSFRVRARASDTGGNATWSSELTVGLLYDTNAPVLVATTPAEGAAVLPVSSTNIIARFSERLDAATVGTNALRLLSAGTNNTFGDSDDVYITGLVTYRDELNSIVFSASQALAAGNYRIIVGTNITDLSGNVLGTTSLRAFRVIDSLLIAYSVSGSPEGTNWLMTIDGSYDQPITTGEWPRLSPNGRYLAFRRGTRAEIYARDIWVRDLVAGTEQSVVVVGNFSVGNVTWTGDSEYLIFDFDYQLRRIHRTGTGLTIGNKPCTGWWPTVNGVDQSYLFAQPPSPGGAIQYAPPNLSQCLDIPNAKSGFNEGHPSSPSWSPDGQRIAFLFGRAASTFTSGLQRTFTEGNLYTIRPDGTDRRQLTAFSLPWPNYSGPQYLNPSLVWTPTGDAIITAGRFNGEYGIYRIEVGGTNAISPIKRSPTLPINYVGNAIVANGPSQ